MPAIADTNPSIADGYRLYGHGKPLLVRDATNGVYSASAAGVDFWSTNEIHHGYNATDFYSDPIGDGREGPSGGPPGVPDGVGDFAVDGDGVLINNADGSVILWTPKS